MRNQRPRISAFAGIVALLAGAGCSSHSIREGQWELSFNAQDSLTRQPVPAGFLPPTRVLVDVEWSDGGETVGILDPKRNLEMYGKIPEGKKELYVQNATDDYWIFQLKGNVKSPELVDGTSFAARSIFDRNTGFEGRWRMQYVGEE